MNEEFKNVFHIHIICFQVKNKQCINLMKQTTTSNQTEK